LTKFLKSANPGNSNINNNEDSKKMQTGVVKMSKQLTQSQNRAFIKLNDCIACCRIININISASMTNFQLPQPTL